MSQWPEDLEALPEYKPFKDRATELVVDAGVLLWGGRVVIPFQVRSRILEELHMAHVGMSRMKMLARAFFWWPGMDKEVEEMVKTCDTCVEFAPDPQRSLLHPWEKAD